MSSPDLLARVAATEASLAGRPAVDAQLDPRGAARVARAGAPFWIRVLPEAPPATDEAHGPAPATCTWLRVTPGERELVALHAAGDEAGGAPARARAVAVRTERLAWGTSAAPFTKVVARLAIEAEDARRLEVASAITDDEAASRLAVRPLAAALARALGVSLEGDDDADPGAAEASAAEASPADDVAPAPLLARFTLGWEGDRLVLRDLASRGPREGALVWVLVVAAAVVGALAASASLIVATRGMSWIQIALRAGIVAVFALGAFAFFHVARHALRYRAAGAPVVVFADDRVVVAPWVRRDGAIDRRPEGRFGAGVRIAEVRSVHVVPRKEGHAVSLDTEHGPIDVADLADPARAEALRLVVERALGGVASPARRKTSLMRGRERAAVAG